MNKIGIHGKILPIKPLFNIELEKAAPKLGISTFRGVFMRDNLMIEPHINECGILNHDTMTGSGTHWTCWVKNKLKKAYFDPYGLQPPNEMVKYLQPEIQYNTDELQMRGSVVCGDFCLNVLKLLSEGQPFDEVVFSLLIYK